MKIRTIPALRKQAGGYTLLELTFSISMYVVILLSTLSMLKRDTQLAQSSLSTGHVELMAQELLYRLRHELTNAQGANPEAIVTAALDDQASTSLRVDSTLGFPNKGTLILDRGTLTEERINYESLDDAEVHFNGLERGTQCSTATDHLEGGELIWAGLAEPIALQVAPEPELYDGIANGVLGPVFFRGDGTGFSYRKPVDPEGGKNYLSGDKLKWGSDIGGVPSLDGRSSLSFDVRRQFSEVTSRIDINKDGDKLDVFDMGTILLQRWVAGDTSVAADALGMGPAAVLQEQCNYGGDLNSDGFDDPLFLWDKKTRELQIKLFVIGGIANNNPIVREVQTSIFLRNEVEF